MLRSAVARSNVCLEQGLRRGVRRTWAPQRIQAPVVARRAYADEKNTQSVAGVPTGPISATATFNPAQTSGTIAPTTPAATLAPPSGSNTLPPPGANTAAPPPPPKRPRRRFRNFLYSLIILSALGYAGGVYYSLVNDNFHDYFTEYIPFGEDAVAYFEEREFRRRFPSAARDGSPTGGRLFPQRTGEQKVTIGRQSGLTAKVADASDDKGKTDLGAKGRHVSAKEEPKPKASSETSDKAASQGKGTAAPKEEKPSPQAKTPDAKAVPKQEAEKTSAGPKKAAEASKAIAATPATPKAAEQKPAEPAVEPIDHLYVPDANEPAVQDFVAFVNRVIAVVNASPEASKYKATLAKEEVHKLLDSILAVKDRASQDAESKVKQAHAEFDEAARELVKRVEREMQEQEIKWREEYEADREKLSESYQQKLALELDAAKKVAEQKRENALLEQEIVLQRQFLDSVKNSVETERQGRLSKLDDLSTSVSDLEKLTSEATSVVDATLQTQHLQVALEAVRAKVMDSEHPTPFLNELVALKEISTDSSDHPDPVVSAAISTIPPTAYQNGIPTPSHLIDRFRRVASEVRKAALLPEHAGVASHAASALLSRFMFKKNSSVERGLPEGEDVEAVLSRTEVLLEEGDLDAAAREMNSLGGWAGVLGRDWVSEVRRVLEVRQAVEVIATEARLRSLLVD